MKKSSPLDGLPSTLKIGHYDYEVLLVPKGSIAGERYGQTNSDGQQITLERGHRKDRTLEVVLHEVLHGIWDESDLPPRATEEKAITHIARGLLQVLKSNKKFRIWFAKEICECPGPPS